MYMYCLNCYDFLNEIDFNFCLTNHLSAVNSTLFVLFTKGCPQILCPHQFHFNNILWKQTLVTIY